MKKVYQTIIDTEHGNCMQAVVASLFDKELNEVPNFIEVPTTKEGNWYTVMYDFFKANGCADMCTIYKGEKDTEQMKKIAKFDGGVNGFFYATVDSLIYEKVGHAVVVDTDLNIVHDPNPNEIYLKLKPEDVKSIMVVHEMIIGKTGRLFTHKEWDEASPEVREENTYNGLI